MTPSVRVAGALLVLFLLLPGYGMCEGKIITPEHASGSDAQAPGRVIAVPAGASLQRALDAARPGDTLSLQAGATFVGPFRLPRKSGSEYIVIRSAAEDKLPPAGTRVAPSDARFMPKLEASSGPVIAAASGAHHYRFVGLEIRPASGVFIEDVVRLGAGRDTSKETLPAFIAIDRCYIHGDAELGARRGVALNSASSEVMNSYVSGFREAGADSQAIAGWGGPGPFRIVNNYLEAAGENVMFGGADPRISGLVPTGIEVLRNHLAKPLAWKNAAQGWTVKNIFELKNARKVRIDGNLFENNWLQSQSGFAILFTVRNQNGGAPWSVVEDVDFTNNVVRHSAAGVYVLGHDDNYPSAQAKRIRIQNNLFDDIGGATWGGSGTLLQLIGGASGVTFDHNTGFQSGNVIMAEGPTQASFVFSNNIVPANQYGIIGTGTGPGLATLGQYFPDAVVKGNVIVGGASSDYPAGNFFPSMLGDVGFAQAAHTEPRLSSHSPYHRTATDGHDVGVDVDALERASKSADATVTAAKGGPAP